MNTYKIGNNIKCTIRSYSSGPIGDQIATYGNQPYTVINNASATIRFNIEEAESKGIGRYLNYAVDKIDQIELSEVLLTDKILNLIFSKTEGKLINVSKNFDSNEKKEIYLNNFKQPLYQVFVYNANGELEAAYGELIDNKIVVKEPNANYLVFYGYEANYALDLNRNLNTYVTLDLELTGNKNDSTSKYWIHLDKCSLVVNKELYFSREINAINLEFKVINTEDNYIIVQ